MGAIGYLSKQSKPFLITLGFLLVTFLGIVDAVTGSEVEFSIFYLVPVSLVAWLTGRRAGIVIAVASTITWLIAHLVAAELYSCPCSHFLIPYWNAGVHGGFFLIFAYTLSALKSALDQEKRSARTDYLTGVANARLFFDLANMEINRAGRYKHPFTVAYMDIDGFKTINDRLGHGTGNTLLRVVAETIRDNTRASDVVARLGGDEFAILLPETGNEAARAVIQRVQEGLRGAADKNGWAVTFSIGLVTFDSPPSSVDEAMRQADRAMYSAKRSHKKVAEHEALREPVPGLH